MKYKKEELEQAYDQLLSEQSLSKTILGSLLGSLIGVAIFMLFALMGGTIFWTILIPPFLVGYCAAYYGRPFSPTYRVIAGFFGILTFIGGVVFVFLIKPIFWLLAPVSFLISYYFAKPKMSKVQEAAVWKMDLDAKS